MKARLWTGRILSGWMAAFLLFDGVVKLLNIAGATEASARLGLSADLIVPIGIVELACLALYLIPSSSVIGAVLFTGYLGGAVATQIRMHDAWFLMPIGVGAALWVGLYLRDARLRAFLRPSRVDRRLAPVTTGERATA